MGNITKLTFICISCLASFNVNAESDSPRIIKLSPEKITQHNVDLPLNQFKSLEILAAKNVSSGQVPRPYQFTGNNQASLFGVDLNNNGIRDDYERMLLKSYQRSEYVAMGILAAERWDKLLRLLQSQESIKTPYQALELFNDTIAINQCYYSLQQIDKTLISPVLSYFNNDQLLEAKYKAELLLLDIIGSKQTSFTFHQEPCERFAEFAKKTKTTKFAAL
ncbi:hypothetical protein C0W88_03945 [Photobacterium leiognathi subsp. mandapamensis]|uniref:hypothetical protein n=1 Tax=Photobacterium leiognathi TaxID=553611 RepID=UPI000D1727C9|nr:hypothetical protein [Photobacterium leiognathi]PSW67331.1 hypothetical protein C0W88_03945 [Photobacterium leiognathi subsp. mandapamensis]